MKAIIREETIGKKKLIYKQPKKVRCCARYKESGKVKSYSEEEIFLYRMRDFKSLFNFQTI